MRKGLTIALALAVSVLGGSGLAAKTLRLSYIDPEGGTWDRGAKRFAELVRERSKGELIIQTFPGSVLANRNQQAEAQAVQAGTIDAVLISPIILALFIDPRFDMYSLPFLFPDLQTALAAADDLKPLTDRWLGEKGLKGVAIGANGFRQVTNSKRPIRTPADMRGLKFRVAGTQLFLKTFGLLGASAITMNFGEVFTSIQQGVIDGQENPLGIIQSTRLFEVQDYVTLWNYAFDPIILTFNQRVWNSLTPAEQRILQAAGEEGMKLNRQLTAQADRDLPAAFEKNGMKVYRPTAAELKAFEDAVKPVYNDPVIVSRIGAANIKLILSQVATVRRQLGR